MIKHYFLPLLILFIGHVCLAQKDENAFTDALQTLYNASHESKARWEEFTQKHTIPFIVNDSVAFLYFGKAKSVAWVGDFNGWGYDKDFATAGTLIPQTDIWILKKSFPQNARFDYKILVDNTQWFLDPANPYQQWSGVGGGSPNSELRMTDWKEDPVNNPIAAAPAGVITEDILINSMALGYQLTYSVYTPPGYTKSQHYPVVYVLDGYEYMHDKMGNMIVILNNLIYLKKIKPVVAIFIDHREPINRSNNKRMTELNMNPKYLNFVATELIPAVEKQYSTTDNVNDRAIIGTSMGGLTAAYFAFSTPPLFGMAGIQSPAFWFKPDIYAFCDNPLKPAVKIFMTSGTINDTEEGARKMKKILDKNTCVYEYKEVTQGHSWGNWKDLIDDILIYFFPPTS